MKKYNIYYGTEENAFEIDQHGPMPLKEALDTMQKWIGEEDEEFDRKACKKMLLDRGYDYEEMENAHDYHILIGIAEEGNTGVEDILTDYRNEFIGEFDYEDDEC
jgi:hypothetical protein